MSADKELLAHAAKAAGLIVWTDCDGNLYTGEPERAWDPLTDDGDALRLAVNLALTIEVLPRLDDVQVSSAGSDLEWYEPRGANPCAATRLAIVRAAAEIGRAM